MNIQNNNITESLDIYETSQFTNVCEAKFVCRSYHQTPTIPVKSYTSYTCKPAQIKKQK